MHPTEPPFAPAPGPHAARMEELVRKLWRDLGIEPPSPARPLAPVARVLDECALNAHEIPLLTRRLALGFLAERGVLAHPAGSPDASNLDLGCRGEDGGAGAVGWDEPLAGFLFANAGGAAVFVRLDDPIARRRFSAAHELGHFVLHFVPQATALFARRERFQFTSGDPTAPALTVARTSNSGEPQDEAWAQCQAREAEADAFAAELLMPCALVSEMAWRERPRWCDNDLIWRLSQQFLVSRKAMWVRLSQLGWVNSASPYS